MTNQQQQAIEDLFRRYAAGVGSYVLARVGSAEAAEEVTSRVFLTVVRQIDRLRGSPAGWLWAIAQSEVARHYRDRGRTVPLEAEPPARAEGPLGQIVRRETQAQLQGALEQLPEEQRKIIYMKFFLEMSNQEIAETAGLSPSNVGVIVFRALRQLRELLKLTEPILKPGQDHDG